MLNLDEKLSKQSELCSKIKLVQDFALSAGVSKEEFEDLCYDKEEKPRCPNLVSNSRSKFDINFGYYVLGTLGVLSLLLAVLISGATRFGSSKCMLYNNFIIKEITRPILDCNFCSKNVEPITFENLTKELFSHLAYSSKPVLVRHGCEKWDALTVFSFKFFRDLYLTKPELLKTVEDECQFFSFNTTFLTLEDVFNMPATAVTFQDGPWYIGWSNCNPEIASELRQHYKRPEFLPDNSEASAIDWIFMGGAGKGASMHIDYVHRPSWQAQISGKKTWTLVPPPECEAVCSTIRIDVNKGDIVLIDTNKWYHDTFIHPGEMSITIGSEYD